MNRAVGRRALFENSKDTRHFLAQIARVVRRGWLELHAYSVLPTHFHLLVRSPMGRLSEAVRAVELTYAMYFNRTHERDGHLVQGRFRSKPVHSITYRHLLVGYIDWNAVDARIVDDPAEYPFSSAWHFARPRVPRWLSRHWIEGTACRISQQEEYSPAVYRATLGARPTRGRLRIVLPRLSAPPGRDELDDLVGASAPRLREWFERRAREADGMGLGPPLVDEESVDEGLRLVSADGWIVAPRGRPRDARRILHAALLRMLSRLSAAAIGRVLALTPARVADALAAHRELMQDNPSYADVLARAAEEAIRRCHGSRPESAA
jgi:hypothetical protein